MFKLSEHPSEVSTNVTPSGVIRTWKLSSTWLSAAKKLRPEKQNISRDANPNTAIKEKCSNLLLGIWVHVLVKRWQTDYLIRDIALFKAMISVKTSAVTFTVALLFYMHVLRAVDQAEDKDHSLQEVVCLSKTEN
uniref:Uncharacterized protein n=1 Tax=Glossina austeni TaxID=7395 RepID=A0A1A9UGQ5_GLOAU